MSRKMKKKKRGLGVTMLVRRGIFPLKANGDVTGYSAVLQNKTSLKTLGKAELTQTENLLAWKDRPPLEVPRAKLNCIATRINSDNLTWFLSSLFSSCD